MAARRKHRILYEVHHPRNKVGDPALRTRPFAAAPESDRPQHAQTTQTHAPGKPAVSHAPVTFVGEERRRVTISYSTLAVLAAGAVVLLAVAFSAGRRYEAAHPSAAAKEETAQGQGADAQTVREDDAVAAGDAAATGQTREPGGPGQRTVEPQPAGAERGRVALQQGYHYVVVQHFGGKRQDAIDTATYLQDNGVPCAMLPGKDIRVVATEPFLISQAGRTAAQRERQRADQLIERIKRIGKEFKKYREDQGKGSYTLEGAYLFEIR